MEVGDDARMNQAAVHEDVAGCSATRVVSPSICEPSQLEKVQSALPLSEPVRALDEFNDVRMVTPKVSKIRDENDSLWTLVLPLCLATMVEDLVFTAWVFDFYVVR